MLRVIIFVIIVVVSVFLWGNTRGVSSKNNINNAQKFMKLTSSTFTNNETIPLKYTCDGENINPVFFIEGVPEAAKSLAFVFDDPDAPTGTWIHWIVWDINPDTTEIQENSLPIGAKEGITSFGDIGYGGPCPQSGIHRYSFRIYALSKILNLPKGTAIKELESGINTNVIDRAEIVGLYGRLG